MRNPAAANGRVNRKSNISNIDYATRDSLQARRIARLYAVTYATTATIARLCYSVAP
jgi:hypothetical protein